MAKQAITGRCKSAGQTRRTRPREGKICRREAKRSARGSEGGGGETEGGENAELRKDNSIDNREGGLKITAWTAIVLWCRGWAGILCVLQASFEEGVFATIVFRTASATMARSASMRAPCASCISVVRFQGLVGTFGGCCSHLLWSAPHHPPNQ